MLAEQKWSQTPYSTSKVNTSVLEMFHNPRQVPIDMVDLDFAFEETEDVDVKNEEENAEDSDGYLALVFTYILRPIYLQCFFLFLFFW